MLPDYVIAHGDDRPAILVTPAHAFVFPLTDQDLNDLDMLQTKYAEEENCSGLAAPQIGISKCAIIFEVPDDEILRRFRKDLTQSMPKTLWLNPHYEGIESKGTNDDWEGCFSVADLVGLVTRYNEITYEAYDKEGVLHAGMAQGFLARVIQHEIDHLNGQLFIDLIPTDRRMTREAYMEMRKKAMEGEA